MTREELIRELMIERFGALPLRRVRRPPQVVHRETTRETEPHGTVAPTERGEAA